MATVFKTRVIKIGNSQGIRIPKVFLEQVQFEEEVELELQAAQIIVRPAYPRRHNWEESFKVMAERGDDYLLDAEGLAGTEWDEEEWEW